MRAVPGQLQLVPGAGREITRRWQPTSATSIDEYPALIVELQREAGVARQTGKVVVIGESHVRALELWLDSLRHRDCSLASKGDIEARGGGHVGLGFHDLEDLAGTA